MVIELRPSDKLRGRNAAAVTAMLGAILRAAETEELDLGRLRVVGDWVQYKKNFRAPIAVRHIQSAPAAAIEIAVDLRRGTSGELDVDAEVASALVAARNGAANRLYLEPWCRTSASCIWAFNMLYWKALGRWEAISGRSYESALPGGESDARNAAAARETILELFATWDQLAGRRALPDQLHVLELGVGNGNQARVWLDEFVLVDRELGRDYYRRLHYLMGDYSPHLLEMARTSVAAHAEHVSALVLDATRPSTTLGFLKYKAFLVYISNVYDNLPTDEIARLGGRLFQVESRAYLGVDDAVRIATAVGAAVTDVPDLIRRLLRLGPELLAETAPNLFADPAAAARFWRDVWEALQLEDRYAPLVPLDEYEVAPGVSGEMLRAIVEGGGDLRMHVSNGAAGSFADTLPLLHPHGILQCHDLFVTRGEQYANGFRGPGKYDGSVVNWVNGPVLAAIGGRRGFEVGFRPFAHRSGSNITTMFVRVRE
jgi:hypothetical protein